MRTLLILRHAKSDWKANYGADHDRPLNKRGVQAATKVGKALSRLEALPDLIVTSSAVRTLQTTELAVAAGKWDAPVVVEPTLYDAGVSDVISVLETQPNVATLMVVGHQPTCGYLIQQLTGARVTVKTATVASITFPISSWAAISNGQGTLNFLIHPRALLNSSQPSSPGSN